jgi:hypothetical protein
MMFYGCTNLTTIYVSDLWNMDSVEEDGTYPYRGAYEIFMGCTSLTGGSGTKYSYNYTRDYAHIDGGTDNPGYFTDIADKK